MAKIKFSALVSDIRNSLNGSTFARNRGGSYFRNKTTPSNPQTASQSLVRSGFGGISQAWRGLTEAQRSTWNEGSSNFPYTDQFGDSRVLSGFQLHQKLNTNLRQVSIAPLQSCPQPQTMFELGSMSVISALATSELDVVIAPTPVPVGFSVVVQATRPVSNGRTFVKNDYRTIGTGLVVGAGGVIDIFAVYSSKFGAPVLGAKIGVRVWLVNTATGQVTPSVQVVTILA